MAHSSAKSAGWRVEAKSSRAHDKRRFFCAGSSTNFAFDHPPTLRDETLGGMQVQKNQVVVVRNDEAGWHP
jgi:hypothetical protein